MACTRPPSAPRNVAFNINETALVLEWSPPSDTGGRKDLTYSVICKKCGLDNNQCEDCGGGLRFIPRHTGLINNSVIVLDFVSHVNYTFEIEAMNGVSELSISPKPFTAITVTTDQDGTILGFGGAGLAYSLADIFSVAHPAPWIFSINIQSSLSLGHTSGRGC
ncbi:Ephrin type-A receptor 6 [Microtus ochrogaster]|uniref:Ephrin type-A receptor 6 n=1 Tax=Microtus ochrogaster TaxID=79684 RepID=A0A8J6KJU2_MICOH|nr:Ephrin type-A receptor 6 [Microtus ochrogaster]